MIQEQNMPSGSHHNQIAVITGASQGIGYAIAQRLARNGAKIVIWDIDEKTGRQSATKLGQITVCEYFCVDMTDWQSVARAAQGTIAQLGRIDILVNNAGISGKNAPVAQYPVVEWHKVIALNLDGVFYGCRAVIDAMIAQNYGRIVNIASIAGKEGNPNAAAYSAAKAGVIALTKSLAKELADYDIGVNCVTPSACRTAIFDQMEQSHIDYMLAKIPRGRFVTLEEIAAMVAFISSRENSFATGAAFDISGGRATY